MPGAQAAGSFYDLADPLHGAGTPADAMMLADYVTYLPDDLLCKVDRTSMAVSLEARAPLLDSRVAEFAWSLPLGFKRSETTSKVLLSACWAVMCRSRWCTGPSVASARRSVTG